MAVTGKSAIEAMGTQMKMPDWNDIPILGAQLNSMPLDEHADVSLKTVIGKRVKKPMMLDVLRDAMDSLTLLISCYFPPIICYSHACAILV